MPPLRIRPCRLPARLSRHLRDARHRQGRQSRQGQRRSGSSADARRALHESHALRRAHASPRSAAHAAATRRPQGRRPLRSDRLGRSTALRRRAPEADRGPRARSDPAVQLRGHDGPRAGRKHRRAVFQRARCVAARSDDLRRGRRGGPPIHLRREPRHAHRVLRGKRTDPDLGRESDRVEPAFLDARAGSEASRRAADRDRSVSLADRRKVSSAHRAEARAPMRRSRSR